MKSKLFVLGMAWTMLLLAACGGSADEPTSEPVPTAVPPTTEPVAEAEPQTGTTVVVHTPDPDLINTTWVWERRDPNGSDVPAVDVPTPEQYSLRFNADGTFTTRLDCNNGAGEYTTSNVDSPDRNIIMSIGPMQMAVCPEPSLDVQMSQLFNEVQSYSFTTEGNDLVLEWANNGPRDYFLRVDVVEMPAPAPDAVATGVVTAPDGIFLRRGPGTNYPAVGVAPVDTEGQILGVSEDGSWWLALAPNLPGGQVWVSAEFVTVTNGENVPVVHAPAVGETLTNVPWEWVSTTTPVEQTVVPNPENYLIIFNTDETAAIRADCNGVQATYTADASNVSLTLGATTTALCAPESLSDTFLTQLGMASAYFVEGGNLYLEMPADGGTMRFVPQGTPLPTADAPAGEADSQILYVTAFGPTGAEQPILPGTTITAHFADSNISGNAGCNNYSAAITGQGDGAFSVGPAMTTRQACAEPAGVMDQEQAYLDALSRVQAYVWEAQEAADGSMVLDGYLLYALEDDSLNGVIRFTSSP